MKPSPRSRRRRRFSSSGRTALAGLVVLMVAAPAAAQRRFTDQHVCSAAQREAGCLIVLGSGMPLPDPARSGPAYAFVIGERTFLFDAGAGVMRRAAAAGLPIDGFTHVFLTHLHSDHTLGLPDVMLTTWTMGRRTAMRVSGPPGTRAMVGHLAAAWGEDIRVRVDGLERGQPDGWPLDVQETTGGVVYDSAGVRITAILVPHVDFAASFAYRIQTPTRVVVLSGDTGPSPGLEAAARGADLLVHETFPLTRLTAEDRPGGDQWPAYMLSVHTSDVALGELAQRARVKQLVLSHIVYMGGTDADVIAGVRRGGYAGPLTVATDLEAY